LNNENHTALYYAAKHGYRLAADALIASGADKSTSLNPTLESHHSLPKNSNEVRPIYGILRKDMP